MAQLNHAELNLAEETNERSSLGMYVMNGGQGSNSYAQNSSYQRGVVDVAKPIIEEEIAKKLDINRLSITQKRPFCIADFGCSTGHNSFPAMQIITEAVEKKFQTQGLTSTSQIPDFHVFFNDKVMNDFNTLFHSLPPQRNYYAAGVPGSFHGRLFPKASLDFAYCSCALNWISDVPKAVADHKSPAWNKGKVHYAGSKAEVIEAYLSQYANNIESFLEARAEELVSGGLMVLLIAADPASMNSASSSTAPIELNLLSSCLVDMANKGILSEEKIDTFNFPMYFTRPEELKAIIERCDSFSIERMEILENPGKQNLGSVGAHAALLRGVFEGMLINHFGSEVVDEVFELYTKKVAASPLLLDPDSEKSIVIFCLLKRKVVVDEVSFVAKLNDNEQDNVP